MFSHHSPALPGPGDHRSDEDELGHRRARRRQRASEGAERLGHDDEFAVSGQRTDDGVGMIAGRRVRIAERQRRRQAAVAQRAQRLDRRVVDARVSSRAGNEDKGRHS